jgi:hypothetical protein
MSIFKRADLPWKAAAPTTFEITKFYFFVENPMNPASSKVLPLCNQN